MDARILRIELRRSVAPWAALLIAAAGVFVAFVTQPPYTSWMQLVVDQRQIMQLTWPLALGAGAWQGLRERRSRVEELMATTPRRRWRRVLPVATAMAIAAIACYLVMFAGVAAHIRHLAAYFPVGAVVVIALGALGLLAAVWIGLAIGRLLPFPLTPPMLAVAGFVVLAMLPSILFDHRNRPGGYLLFPQLDGPRDGAVALQTLSAQANLGQALWLGALAGAGLALFAAARPAGKVAAVLAVVLGATIAMPVMPGRMAAAWVEDRGAREVVCTGSRPEVCAARVHSYALDEFRGPARTAVSILAAKLPPAPARVLARESIDGRPGGPQPADTLLMLIPPFHDVTKVAPDDLVRAMLDGAGMPLCENLLDGPDGPSLRYHAARGVAAAWLLDRDPPAAKPGADPEFALIHEALAGLRRLPPDQQRARVAAYRDAERACAAGDRLELLTGRTR